jgi:XTP/dITP diphosphohydrolase
LNTPRPSVVLASHNKGKLAELQALFAPLGWQVQPVRAFSDEEPAETAGSFAGNALIKARHAARVSGLPAIADDSGLCVDALQGAPGVESAYFAGRPSRDAANNALLLQRLEGVPEAQRGAQFVCVMAYVDGTAPPLTVEGRWPGRILTAPRGEHGFGYDPLFYVPTHGCTSAELPPALKNEISHRGQAARALLQALLQARGAVRA